MNYLAQGCIIGRLQAQEWVSTQAERRPIRGAFHSFEKAYEIFSEQKDFYGFLMDFSCKQKDFCQRRTRFFGVKCPSGPFASPVGNH